VVVRRRHLLILLALAAGLVGVALFEVPEDEDFQGLSLASNVIPPQVPPVLSGIARPEATEDVGDSEPAARVEGLRLPARRIPLRVDLVDGRTGALLGGTWNLGEMPRGRQELVERWEAAFLASGAASVDALQPGTKVDLPLTVRPPRGFACVESAIRLSGEMALGATSAYAVVPLLPEVTLDLRVLCGEGRFASDLKVQDLRFVSAQRTPRVLDVGADRLRILGLPHLPGASVAVKVTAKEHGTHHAGLEASRTLRMPVDPRAPWEEVILLGDAPRISFGVGVRYAPARLDQLFPVRALPLGLRTSVELGGCDLEVHVVTWQVAPAWSAVVDGFPADAEGVVRLRELPAGTRPFTISGPGMLHAAASFEVRSGETVSVRAREPIGARLEVLVTNEAGTPMPFAGVRTSSKTLDVVHGAQRLDAWTDARGSRAFERVQPGSTNVDARWGDLRGTAAVLLEDERTTEVVIVVR
jgi:hypothetical protein